jgi:DNA sulfur modification protein DndE
VLPNRVSLSQQATGKLRYIKGQTGLSLNILSRIAIMLTINEGNKLQNAGVNDYDGQILSRDVLFGDHQDIYSILINEHMKSKEIDMNLSEAISAMIEIGVFKMGHIKNLLDLAKL